jgi:hypothetical protein
MRVCEDPILLPFCKIFIHESFSDTRPPEDEANSLDTELDVLITPDRKEKRIAKMSPKKHKRIQKGFIGS